jgi:hypothetical protein
VTDWGTAFHRGGGPSTIRQYAGALIGGAVYAFGSDSSAAVWSLTSTGPGARQALYISLAASSGALLGFAITAVSILITLGDGPRMAWLRHQPAFTQTRFVYMTAIRALGTATLVFTALIALDDGHELDAWLAGVAAGVLLLVVVRLCWVIWLMNRLVGLATQDQAVSPDHIVPFSEPSDEPGAPADR